MKKIFIVFIVMLSLFLLLSCASCAVSEQEKNAIVPDGNTSFKNYTIGNVIDEGKQAVFFNFVSNYNIKKLEISGHLLDSSGNTIYTFETTQALSTPTKKPEVFIRIASDLVKRVRSVTFTKITAYTADDIIASE